MTARLSFVAMQVLRQILAGLAYIHSQGIIHRYAVYFCFRMVMMRPKQ